MVAANYWPPAKVKPQFRIEEVSLPVFGDPEGVPFPRFDLELPEGKSKEDFVLDVEMRAQEIVGDITDKEYLARRQLAGNMPRLNRVFEELGIKYENHLVLSKVLRSVKEKEEKMALERAKAEKAPIAEGTRGRKRCGASAPEPARQKKQRAALTLASGVSTSAEEVEEGAEVETAGHSSSAVSWSATL